jgi:hypothetical protein
MISQPKGSPGGIHTQPPPYAIDIPDNQQSRPNPDPPVHPPRNERGRTWETSTRRLVPLLFLVVLGSAVAVGFKTRSLRQATSDCANTEGPMPSETNRCVERASSGLETGPLGTCYDLAAYLGLLFSATIALAAVCADLLFQNNWWTPYLPLFWVVVGTAINVGQFDIANTAVNTRIAQGEDLQG